MIELNPTVDDRPQPDVGSQYDVVVIGGGPAGTTTAALLAEAGQSVLLLERSRFPRFHLGESLIPETYGTLKRLGVIDELRRSAFPKKYSVQFVSDGRHESAPFYFDEHKPGEGSQTWQIVRSAFDKMLLENAVSKGAAVHTGAQVLEPLFDGDQATGVRVKLDGDDRSARTVASRVLVDASGQSAFLANRLGLRRPDPRLKKGTVWTYFRGAQRDSGRDEGATIILQTEGKLSWFWYIPLPDDIVSVGCTGSMSYMFGRRGESPEDIFARELARCPAMKKRLEQAERHTDYLTTKDFSYRATQAAGPGWVLVGDAFGFIDPVYSTGVFLALKSGELAADAIQAAVRDNELSAARLVGWHEPFVAGMDLFRKLVYAFYTPGFSFGEFLRRHPEYRGHLTDILIGDVFKPGVGEIFDAMGEVMPPSDLEQAGVA